MNLKQKKIKKNKLRKIKNDKHNEFFNEFEYYDVMCDITKDKKYGEITFEEINERWFKCFTYILKNYKVNYSHKSIKSLYYGFRMENWTELKVEVPDKNTENEAYIKRVNELLENFSGECNYISDRCSYDRLFRAHHIFMKIYWQEIMDYILDNNL